MNRYSRWNAPSDRDYDDTCQALPSVTVTCNGCHRLFDAEYDDRPPYRCPQCIEKDCDAQEAHDQDRVAS